MARLASRLDGLVDARTEVEEGLPSDVIAGKSKEFDLVVLGRKPPGRRWSLFAKHTVERVAREACCPVIAVGEDDS